MEAMASESGTEQPEQPEIVEQVENFEPGNDTGTTPVVTTSLTTSEACQPSIDSGVVDGENMPGVESVAGVEGIEGAEEPAPGDNPKKKKKKKKRPMKSLRNITGFEEYYADPPTTPAEALKEKEEIYKPSRPFADRIEECIQRYRARRRLNNDRTNMFNRYLYLGGIDCSPRQFNGMVNDKDAMAEADADGIRLMTAVDFIGPSTGRFYDPGSPEGWEVDFEAVVKGFLSRTIPDWYMYDAEANKLAADLIKNFLNYVLMHNVCPEYTEQIQAARLICDIAPTQLQYMHELMFTFPGTFNGAARRLFCEGGVNDLENDENAEAFNAFRFTTLVWAVTPNAQLIRDKLMGINDPTSIHVVSTTKGTCEVVEFKRPSKKNKATVDEQLAKIVPGLTLKPAGFIRVIPGIIAHGWSNLPRPDEVDFSNAPRTEYVLEDEILAKMAVGMKFEMTVCELDIGLSFIKEVHEVRVPFDILLPQHLMTEWKEPAEKTRPAPSVHDPHSEDREMEADMRVDD